MKTIFRLILIFIVFIGVLVIWSNNMVEAKVSDTIGLVQASDDNNSGKYDEMEEVVGKLLGFLQVASALVSVVIIAFTGFNYIITLNPDVKKEMKDKMLPLIIGLILIFSATSITKFIIGATGDGGNSQISQLKTISNQVTVSTEVMNKLPKRIQSEIADIQKSIGILIDNINNGNTVDSKTINSLKERAEKVKQEIDKLQT